MTMTVTSHTALSAAGDERCSCVETTTVVGEVSSFVMRLKDCTLWQTVLQLRACIVVGSVSLSLHTSSCF